MQKRQERLIAEERLRASAWWLDQNARFFSTCLRPRRRKCVGEIWLWLTYREHFTQRGYWCSREEFYRHLSLSPYKLRDGRVLDVEFVKSSNRLVRRGPSELGVGEVRDATGIPAALLAALREADCGPPYRYLGRKILYNPRALRKWLAEDRGKLDDKIRVFASACLKFRVDGDDRDRNDMAVFHGGTYIAASALREALRLHFSGFPPAGAYGSLVRLLKAKGCKSGVLRDADRAGVRVWHDVWKPILMRL